MKSKFKKNLIAIVGIIGMLGAVFGFTACSTQADIASRNVSLEAEEFRVDRRIVAINMITDKYLFMVTGKCSIERLPGEIEITCKVSEGTAPTSFQKHFVEFAEGANLTTTIEQLSTSDVNSYHYEFIFRPESIVPTIIR